MRVFIVHFLLSLSLSLFLLLQGNQGAKDALAGMTVAWATGPVGQFEDVPALLAILMRALGSGSAFERSAALEGKIDPLSCLSKMSSKIK